MEVNRYKYWSLKNVEVRSILLVLCLLIPSFLSAQYVRTFPYYLPLTGTTKPAEIIEAPAVSAPVGINRYTKDGLVLTGETKSSKSGFALNDIKFTSAFGIVVEFDYAMFGGTNPAGDGMSFFLFDADVAFTLGNSGSGLGYAYAINPQGPNYVPNVVNVKGLNGGFLGVGLDVWGNFRSKLNEVNQIVEGIPDPRTSFTNDGKNYITIRGGANTNNDKGYPVLFTTATNNDDYNGVKYTQASRNNTGYYSYLTNRVATPFSLRTSKAANGVITYNRVRMEVMPSLFGGVLISLFVTSNGVEYVIVKDYYYILTSKSLDHNGNIYTATTNYPAFFKLGFTAGTGAYTQYHIVKDVKVDLPFASEMKEDNIKECISPYGGNTGVNVSMYPLANDKFYVGAIASNPTSGTGTNYMDYSSFRFEDSVGNALYSVSSGNTIYHDQTGVGRWVFDKTTGKVTLTLSQETYGTGTTTHNLKMYYSIKGLATGGGPFNDEYYRSEPTAINVALEKCKTDIDVRINPNMSIEGL